MNYSFMYTFDEEEIFSHYIDCDGDINMDKVLEEVSATIQKEHKGKSFEDVVGLSILIKGKI